MEDLGNGVLSPSEIDALLNAVNEGEIETEGVVPDGAMDGSEILHYDLTSQDRIIRGRMPTLDLINDRFCRLFRMSLSNALRRLVQVSVESTNLMKFGEFLDYLPSPSCLNIVKLSPLRGSSMMAMESKLLMSFLDIFFGGSQVGGEPKMEQRDFTNIELMLVRRVVRMFLDDLAQAWKPVLALGPEYLRTETNPQFVTIVAPGEVVVQTTYEVETDAIRGSIHMVIPYSSLEPFKDRLTSGFQTDGLDSDAAWSRRFVEKLYDAPVTLRAFLGRTTIDLSRLISLREGDVLTLDTPADSPIPVEVEGKPKLLGRPVISSGNMAVQVTDFLEPEWAKKEHANAG